MAVSQGRKHRRLRRGVVRRADARRLQLPPRGRDPANVPRTAGRFWMEEARKRSIAIYNQAAQCAEQRGIILADTKFEFGVCDGKLILVDEVLTPDSSRFWSVDQWQPGKNPPSFDKQFLRDYLNSLTWNKTPPPPAIPAEILEQMRQRYLDAYRLLTGRSLSFA